MPDKTPVQGVQTALRAVSILEAFSVERPSLTLTEISEQVGLSVPTTHRLIKALQSRSLIAVEPDSRRYSLGSGVMSLARVIMQRDDLVEIARPGLERLRTELMETVSLQTVIGDERVVITELVSPHPIRTSSVVGTRYPLVRGGAGKVILAYLPEKDRSRIIEREATDPAALSREIEKIRARGYATSYSEVVPGATSLAVAVFDSDGYVAGSINITGPTDRFGRKESEAAVPLAAEVAATVTRLLGGVPPVHQ